MILAHDGNLSYFHWLSFSLNHVILLNICACSAFILKMENTCSFTPYILFLPFFFKRNAHYFEINFQNKHTKKILFI